MAKNIKKTAESTPLIDLQKGILLQVAGEEEKDHTLDWDILKKIGDNTQKLISTLAKYSLSEERLDEDAVKLKFVGFHPGSAIPEFDIQKPKNLLFVKEKSYNELNANLSFILGHLGDGNFQAIADKYTEPTVKNEVIDVVTDFSNSAGTKPFSVVRPVNTRTGDKKFKPVIKLRVITPAHKALLKSPVLVAKEDLKKENPIEAVSKILIKKNKQGKITKKIGELYTQKEAILSLKFDNIETDNRIYQLKSELFVSIKDDDKKSYTLENPLLDIYAYGSTLKEAEKDLFDQFDYTFQRLNQISDDKLSKHLKDAKTYINIIVDKIKDK